MGNATHSPAPWEFLEAHSHNDEWSASRPLTICCADNEDVANVFSHNDSTVSITRETAIANAHLIAAAPEMLVALKDAQKTLQTASRQLTEDHKMVLMGRGWGWKTIATIEGAIAKAERNA